MLNRMTATLDVQGQALALRAERQSVLASNIANADTPGYKARDFDFAQALARVTGRPVPFPALATSVQAPAATLPMTLPAAAQSAAMPGHLPIGPIVRISSTQSDLAYRSPEQAAMDGNTVELDRERANFVDNAVRFEATLRFINGNVRTMLSAIRGE
jgi:flagellar basal-body rod protein FlgB